MRNVLLPTDLSLPSLYPIHEIGRINAGHKCRVHVIHTLTMPTGIADLLFLKKPYSQLPPAFTNALAILRQRYSGTITSIHFDFVYNNSRNYLQQYIEAHNIKAVYMLKDHEYDLPLLQSTDCRAALLHCDVPIVHTTATTDMGVGPNFGTLTTLLYNEKKHA